MKHAASWSIPDGAEATLIGRKQVDLSVFEHSGTAIPVEFHEGFNRANGYVLKRPESRAVVLILDGVKYSGRMGNSDRGVAADTLRIFFHRDLKNVLAARFAASRATLTMLKKENGRGTKVRVPISQAEYLDFHATGAPFTYRLELYPLLSS